MRRVFIIMLLIPFIFIAGCYTSTGVHVQGTGIDYTDDGTAMKGYIAYDKNIKGKRPGVLVVHEWWGHNEYARNRARMLAELGYTALAVDMYGDGRQAMHPDEAGRFSSEVMKNFPAARSRFTAAMDILKDHPTVDPDNIAAIGYCFGGGVVLNLARQGIDLKGVASFHGSLRPVRPTEIGGVKAKLLVLHGADDAFIPFQQVYAFKEEMKKAGADLRFISYPGAVHSFTNPGADALAEKYGLGIGYNAEADQKSWDELKRFLKEIFGN
jgi:dienelactone hydrolase